MLPAVGTIYRIEAAKQPVFASLVLDGARWCLVYPTPTSTRVEFDFNVLGRQPARSSNPFSTTELKRANLVSLTTGWAREAEFKQYVQMITGAVAPVLGNKLFSAGDMMV